MALLSSMENTIVFVHPESITSPIRYLFDLLTVQMRMRFTIESEIEQLGPGPVVFTTVSPLVGDFLRSSELTYSFLITPQEDFSGLDQEILRRASKVVYAGVNPTVTVDLSLAPQLQVVDSSYVAEPADEAACDLADGPADVVNFICPTSYLRYWERLVRTRSCPSRINVWTSRDALPPAWFEAALEDHGVSLKVCTPPQVTLDEFLRLGGMYVRNNPTPDRLDLVLRNHRGEILNLHHDRDLRASMGGQATISLAELLALASPSAASPLRHRPSQIVRPPRTKRINIVCFNPTYLFADLTKRFEQAGCVHSDLPDPDAEGYIWLRPQEFGAFGDLLRNAEPIDVPNTYRRAFTEQRERFASMDYGDMSSRSVAIHHGTCYEPIIQFDSYRLAKSLSWSRMVAGVCEFEECYGPSARFANRNNFEFVPIGYDHSLFTEQKIRRSARTRRSVLEIGFVGRAYGTNDRDLLAKSAYAHPKGYRKGGDHLLNILLRLKALGIPFQTHILGQNWDELVQQCERLSLPVRYYTRDKDVSYRDYPSIYAGFDVLLICARGEGGPVSTIEAMSMGVPVVGSNVGLIPYLASLSQHCHMFEYDTKWHIMDYDRAVEHLARIHDSEFGHEERLALHRTVQRFTTDRWVERLIAMARAEQRTSQAVLASHGAVGNDRG